MIKISGSYKALAREIKVLKKIHKSANSKVHGDSQTTGLPYVKDFGLVIGKNLHTDEVTSETKILKDDGSSTHVFGYYIMPKYNVTFENYLSQNKDSVDVLVIIKLIKDVLNSLRHIHKAGFTHNDLKTDNIMLDLNLNAHMIDLGYASQYLDANH